MSNDPLTILCVDDEEKYYARVANALKLQSLPDVILSFAGSLNEASTAIASNQPDIVLTDMRFPESNGEIILHDAGLRLMQQVTITYPAVRCIAMSSDMPSNARDFCLTHKIPMIDKMYLYDQLPMAVASIEQTRGTATTSVTCSTEYEP